MSDPEKTPPEPVDTAPEVPLDQTTPPIDQLQEGEVPLERTRPEIDQFLGSEDRGRRAPRRGRRRRPH